MGSHQTLKVCHIISGDLWAGGEVQVNTLLRELHKDPHLQLSAIVLNTGRLASALSEAGIDTTVIDERKHGFFDIIRQAKQIVLARQPNILHSHRYKENILAAILKWQVLPDAQLVQTVHGIQERLGGYPSLKIRVYQGLNDWITRRSFTRVLPVSHEIAGQLEPKFGAQKLTVVHNSVDPGAIQVQRGRSEILAELGLNESCKLVGTVGRMVPIKGFDQFLAMARAVSEQVPEARFLLVGDGPLLAPLKEQAAAAGLAERLFFLGFRADVWDILGALDLFVMTSHHEGIPVVLLEAMTLQRATVATAVGGIPEVIEPGISGRLVKPGDIAGLVNATVELLRTTAQRETLGRAAHERVGQTFAVAGQAATVRRIYEEICKRP